MANNFLEVDDSIMRRNLLLLPNEERDALTDQMDELMKQLDTKSSILVQPTPGICVKTRTTDGEKIFLNICVCDEIPPPEDISDAKLFELLNDEAPAYTIPMSFGHERMEADKSDEYCATYDVLVNTAYLKKCREKKHFMAFTVLVALSGVEDKFGKKLNTEDYVILKNRKVMGKLQQHRIQNRDIQKPQSPKQLVEEISSSAKPTDGDCPQKNDEVKMGYVILKEPQNGSAKRLIALFDMPKSVSIEDVVVLVNSDRINVTDERARCSYDVSLPYTLNVDNAKAHMDYSIRVLRVDVSVEGG